jgi:MbtH protein
MASDEHEDSRHYTVVINDEGQYSIWPIDGPPLRGWRVIGNPKPKAQCLSEIQTLWTDMRPASLKAHMNGSGATT